MIELDEWDGKRRSYYGKLMAMQNYNAFVVFEDFFDRIHFDTVIELGTACGGLSLFLHMQSLKHNFKFVTYDIKCKNGKVIRILKKRYHVNRRLKNIFSPEGIEEISDLIKDGGKTLLLCDNGNKVREVQIFSPVIKRGDYIMCHDYALSKEHFEKEILDKVWKNLEITKEKIQEDIDKNGLIEAEFENFIRVAWGCFTK